jgi:hypothetical protein
MVLRHCKECTYYAQPCDGAGRLSLTVIESRCLGRFTRLLCDVRNDLRWQQSSLLLLTNNENIDIFVPLATCAQKIVLSREKHCIEETKRYK